MQPRPLDAVSCLLMLNVARRARLMQVRLLATARKGPSIPLRTGRKLVPAKVDLRQYGQLNVILAAQAQVPGG